MIRPALVAIVLVACQNGPATTQTTQGNSRGAPGNVGAGDTQARNPLADEGSDAGRRGPNGTGSLDLGGGDAASGTEGREGTGR